MNCRICDDITTFIFNKLILNKYEVSYFICGQCNLIQTEKPFWLQEAYTDSISICDTGLLQRNIKLSNFVSTLLCIFYPNGRFLDYAGGYGILTRLMRDSGFDFYWKDIHTENIVARSFDGVHDHYDLITTIESFEHFENPAQEIDNLLRQTDSVLFTTELRPENIPDPNTWRYYYFNHGQHVSLYSLETLKYIAKENKLNLYTDGRFFHLLTKRKFGFDPIFVTRVFLKLKLILKRKSKTQEDSDLLSV